MDWSGQNILSVGLGTCVYLWSACTSQVYKTLIFIYSHGVVDVFFYMTCMLGPNDVRVFCCFVKKSFGKKHGSDRKTALYYKIMIFTICEIIFCNFSTGY